MNAPSSRASHSIQTNIGGRTEKSFGKKRKQNLRYYTRDGKYVNIKQKQLLKTVKEKNIKYYGHVKLRNHSSLQKKIVERMVEGTRGRGRRRRSWVKHVEGSTGMKINEWCEIALEQKRWKTMAPNLWKEKEL
ncbi:hypothetical protein EGW08_007595 [Elysia chlorotica]|uniref:Uncharacterized protein n=1 Tax=Elysia chlorotica TaxID=188477 RepID=A0A433TSN0_ELYCH|nr:hypothetical protein EGW08_007595 [Elysia chlorotica]